MRKPTGFVSVKVPPPTGKGEGLVTSNKELTTLVPLEEGSSVPVTKGITLPAIKSGAALPEGPLKSKKSEATG